MVIFSSSQIESGDVSIQQTVEESKTDILVHIRWFAISVGLDEAVQKLLPLCSEQTSGVGMQSWFQFLPQLFQLFVSLLLVEQIIGWLFLHFNNVSW